MNPWVSRFEREQELIYAILINPSIQFLYFILNRNSV